MIWIYIPSHPTNDGPFSDGIMVGVLTVFFTTLFLILVLGGLGIGAPSGGQEE